MRYHWGLGVGHLHAHRPATTSTRIPSQQMDTETSHCVSTDTEAVSSVALEVATINDVSYEFVDPAEMVLGDRDPEGWDNVESDVSEDDIRCNADSEDDLEVYE
jgi:hypothetical protein